MNDLQIAAYLRRFMLVNKKYYFSKDELEYIGKKVLAGKNVSQTRLTARNLNKVLDEHNVKGVWQKHCKSQRHRLWEASSFNPSTLKLGCNV